MKLNKHGGIDLWKRPYKVEVTCCRCGVKAMALLRENNWLRLTYAWQCRDCEWSYRRWMKAGPAERRERERLGRG